MLILLFSLLFNSYAFDLELAHDVVFKPQFKGGKRYGTGFFISPEGHFLATNHGFEVCKNHDQEAALMLQGLECPTYEAIYKGESYSFFLIAYPAFNSNENLTIARSFRRKDFLLGKVDLPLGEEVPFVDLGEGSPIYKYRQKRKIAGVTIEPFFPALMNVILPGFSGGKLLTVYSRMIGKHYDKGYMMTISSNPELKGGSSGSPVFDEEGSFMGILVAKTDTIAVILNKERVVEGLLQIDLGIEEILFQ